MKKTLSYSVNKFANQFGLEIHRYIPNKRAGSLRSMYDVCMQAKKCGLNANTIFDIGVASGTPDLYESFKESKFVLVDPLKEFNEDIASILKVYEGVYINAAASDHCGTTQIIGIISIKRGRAKI
ncbi:MAG: hypothetical protein JEZ00_07690 [Anaerolineaceae bacterium]|nr:hypothetical protein [Anaerolineaceae bacterium]